MFKWVIEICEVRLIYWYCGFFFNRIVFIFDGRFFFYYNVVYGDDFFYFNCIVDFY